MSARSMAGSGLMAALTAVLAYVYVPLPLSPVPVSAQTLAVMLAGSWLGPRYGALSQLVYVLIGAVGIPVYAGGNAGLGVLAGPTGGYLIGFVLGAYVTGLLTAGHHLPSTGRLCAGYVLGGCVAVYVPGVLQLALVTGMSVPAAAAVGVLPFIVGDAVKIVAATLLFRASTAAWSLRSVPR